MSLGLSYMMSYITIKSAKVQNTNSITNGRKQVGQQEFSFVPMGMQEDMWVFPYNTTHTFIRVNKSHCLVFIQKS